MMQDVSLFEVDPESGEVIYNSGDEVIDDVGNDVLSTDEVGDLAVDPQDVSEDYLETEEEAAALDFLDSGSDVSYLVLDEELAAALAAVDPADGTISSGTLDYFDRIVSGLDPAAVYVAYRTSDSSSNDAVLYFGEEYQINDNLISFGDDCVEVSVHRVTGSSGYTSYISRNAPDTDVYLSQSGSTVFYTNAIPGYPVLGGYAASKGYQFYLPIVLVSVLAFVVLKGLFRRF